MLYKLFIKYSLLVNICIIYAAIPVQAKSMYVTDVLKVTLRTGPSINNKIIKMVESGQRVEVVEPGQEWSLIRLFDGKEGWILNRYLIPNETNKLNLERLDEEHSNLKTKFKTILSEQTKRADELEEKVEKLIF